MFKSETKLKDKDKPSSLSGYHVSNALLPKELEVFLNSLSPSAQVVDISLSSKLDLYYVVYKMPKL